MKMSPEPFPEMLPSRPRPSETGRHVGKATSIMWSPTLKKMIALASVGREHAAAGTLLQMEMTVEAVRLRSLRKCCRCRFSIRRARRRHRWPSRNLMRSGEGFCVGEALIEGRAVEKFAAQYDGVNFAGVVNVVERVSV